MRRLQLAPLLAALGGLLLFVSLFMHWYQPALSAWTVFEVWDLVLAVLAIAAVWVAVANVFWEAPLADRVLPVLGGGAFLIVVSQIVNHPPAAQGAKPEIGAWVALVGSAVMAAAGALRAGGLSLSMTVSQDERPATPRRDRRDANPFVELAVPTGLGEARNALVVRSADAVLAIGGAYGTLSEIALALKGGTPVVGLRTWELARGGRADTGVVHAESAEEAARMALDLARK